MLITSLNGNVAVSRTTTFVILSLGTNIIGWPQWQYVSPPGPVHGQNVGTHPTMGERIAHQMGAQWKTQQSQLQHQQHQRLRHNIWNGEFFV